MTPSSVANYFRVSILRSSLCPSWQLMLLKMLFAGNSYNFGFQRLADQAVWVDLSGRGGMGVLKMVVLRWA